MSLIQQDCVPAGKSEITAIFRPAQEVQSQTQAGPSTQADSMAEDLFVMTAGGGLVRHRLTHTHSGGMPEAGFVDGDRCAIHLAFHRKDGYK